MTTDSIASVSLPPRRPKVIIVDDNKINLDLFARALANVNTAEVVSFLNPLEALAWCQDNTPDLVVLDQRMPQMTGIDCLRRLRAAEATNQVPIVMITAFADTTVRYEALGLGADDFLSKPVDISELRLRARNLLNLRAARLESEARLRWLQDARAGVQRSLDARDVETVGHFVRLIETIDEESGNHLARVAHFAELTGRALGLADDACSLLFHAAPLHDLGKLAVPSTVLGKNGRLTAEEIVLVREHSAIGETVLSGSSSEFMRTAAAIAGGHHEKFDGSGYPQRLAGEAIPLVARIGAVVDVFDSLTSVRHHREAWSADRARAYLSAAAGKHLDPACVGAFLSCWSAVQDVRENFPGFALFPLQETC